MVLRQAAGPALVACSRSKLAAHRVLSLARSMPRLHLLKARGRRKAGHEENLRGHTCQRWMGDA